MLLLRVDEAVFWLEVARVVHPPLKQKLGACPIASLPQKLTREGEAVVECLDLTVKLTLVNLFQDFAHARTRR